MFWWLSINDSIFCKSRTFCSCSCPSDTISIFKARCKISSSDFVNIICIFVLFPVFCQKLSKIFTLNYTREQVAVFPFLGNAASFFYILVKNLCPSSSSKKISILNACRNISSSFLVKIVLYFCPVIFL